MDSRLDGPLRRVLVAVDLAAGSDKLVRRALQLPLAAHATIDLVHVLPRRDARLDGTLARSRREARLRSLVEASARDARADLTIGALSTIGRAPDEIVRCSRIIGAELVVVGHERRRRLGDRLGFGSTPGRVLRDSEGPVLVVSLEPTESYRRPIVAVDVSDLSDLSGRVVELARRVVGPDGDRHASLVHAYQIPFESWLREDGLGREFKDEAAARLRRFHRALGDSAAPWRRVLGKGDPRRVILDEVARVRADVVVVGSHGGSGIAHSLRGGIARWVSGEAPCDVLVARP